MCMYGDLQPNIAPLWHMVPPTGPHRLEGEREYDTRCHSEGSETGRTLEGELEVLASVGRLLATQSGQRQMLTAVLDELEQKLGMIRGTIMLLSSDGSELFVEVARDVPQRAAEGPSVSPRRGDRRQRRADGQSRRHSADFPGAAIHQPHPPPPKSDDGRRQLSLRSHRPGQRSGGHVVGRSARAGGRTTCRARPDSWESWPA